MLQDSNGLIHFFIPRILIFKFHFEWITSFYIYHQQAQLSLLLRSYHFVRLHCRLVWQIWLTQRMDGHQHIFIDNVFIILWAIDIEHQHKLYCRQHWINAMIIDNNYAHLQSFSTIQCNSMQNSLSDWIHLKKQQNSSFVLFDRKPNRNKNSAILSALALIFLCYQLCLFYFDD